jgi:hypothetical protein
LLGAVWRGRLRLRANKARTTHASKENSTPVKSDCATTCARPGVHVFSLTNGGVARNRDFWPKYLSFCCSRYHGDTLLPRSLKRSY